jgi:hypothetical protein
MDKDMVDGDAVSNSDLAKNVCCLLLRILDQDAYHACQSLLKPGKAFPAPGVDLLSLAGESDSKRRISTAILAERIGAFAHKVLEQG